MIEELHIRGLGVIEDASLRLAPGLTVVTGETGAGKTMLVTALQLLLGHRADSTLVRQGAEAAFAQAAISPPPEGAEEWMRPDDEVLVVTREIPAQGRSRARINGRIAPVSALADVLGGHVDVHAQHEHVRLEREETQRQLLDRFAGEPHARLRERFLQAYRRWRDLEEAYRSHESNARERARELDRLRAEVAEIDAAEIDLEQDPELDQLIERLGHAEALQLALAEAGAAVGVDGAGQPVGHAIETLRRLGLNDPELEGFQERLDAVDAQLTELATDLRTFRESIDADPERLGELQQRRHLLGQLHRKYGAELTDVVEYAEQARQRITQIEAEEAGGDDLQVRTEQAFAEVNDLSEDLRRGRRAAAKQLCRAVDGHLAELGMPHARFQVKVEAVEGPPRAHGADEVAFMFAPNPGEPARPLATSASGGERSRVALAIEVALADVDQVQVLVFDEVDAGVGGATAMAVGEKLARLASGEGARRRQVLCVTHLAQLAAFADVHHVIEKGVIDGRTVTTTRQVADEGRVAELSRMLGGDASAEAGQQHAREMIDRARERRVG